MATWTGTQLVAVGGANFAIDTQTLSESGGHQVSWTYTWNSAEVTNVAADNLTVRLRAYDFASSSDLDSQTVDVVPYISDITRSLSTNRSKYGRYAVQEGETGVVLSGYNLAQTGANWVRVYNTAGAAYDTVAVTAAGSPYTSMTVSLAAVTHSGWLRLAVNGVEAINNINNNALTPNKEDDGSGLGSTLWSDDRYLRVWAVGAAFNQSDDPEHPSMSISGGRDALRRLDQQRHLQRLLRHDRGSDHLPLQIRPSGVHRSGRRRRRPPEHRLPGQLLQRRFGLGLREPSGRPPRPTR